MIRNRGMLNIDIYIYLYTIYTYKYENENERWPDLDELPDTTDADPATEADLEEIGPISICYLL